MDAVVKTGLGILSDISRISTSSSELPQKLHRILEVITQGMEKDGGSVFLLDRAGQRVTLTAALGLNQESVGRLHFPLGMGIAGWVAQQKVPLALADPFTDERFHHAPESGIERYRSLVAAPIMDEDRCLGVIFVLSLQAWTASSEEVTLLTTTANHLSGVIKSAELFQNIRDRLAELATIHEINMALTSTLDLNQLLSLIVENTSAALHARGAAIRLVNLPEGRAPLNGVPDRFTSGEARRLAEILGDRITALTVDTRRPLLVPDTTKDDAFRDVAGLPPGSIISVPLLFHDRVVGAITLYDREDGGAFDDDDVRFLATIASGAAVAVENASNYERMEYLAHEARSRAQEFSILYDIGTAMSLTLNLDRLLRIILTAATMGGSGLGFNRAILLLTNDRTNMLQGMLGVGPTTWDEANRAWSEVAKKHRSLLEWIQTGELFEHRDTEINALARSIRVPLDRNEGVLALTALDKIPYNIVNAAQSVIVKRELLETIKVNDFATVPLVAKGRVIGVIIVDNMFTGRPITEHDLRFMTMFAHQAALAIDNAVSHSNIETMNRDIRLMHEQLAQSEKMAALGAMMAEITHEIRNPLVSIGGFTRRLSRKVQDEDAKKYINIILSEVARLEGIIHDNLSYIKNVTPQPTLVDVTGVVVEILAVYEEELRQRGISVERELAPNLPRLELDPPQIKQAVINLITNAMEAMEKGGVLTVRTRADDEAREAVIDIIDSGPGVPQEAMPNLFNPYFTTKVRGTGLGLPITHRIVKAHKGTIRFRNGDCGGAIFTIRLPYPRKKEA